MLSLTVCICEVLSSGELSLQFTDAACGHKKLRSLLHSTALAAQGIAEAVPSLQRRCTYLSIASSP